ncbi:MAG: hypothetical protein ACI4EQ_02395 [Lachnospiraceae bacterium]
MKKRNRGTALLLILLLAFFAGGCSSKKTAEVLTGSWSMECDFSEGISAGMGKEFADMETTFMVKVIFEFAQEGTYKMYIDRDSFTESFDRWLDDFATYGTELMYTEFEEKGLTTEEAELIFEEEYGCGITEYLHDTAEGQLDLDSMMNEMMSEGFYETEDNRLYLNSGRTADKNQYVIFTVEENTLTLNLPEGVEEENTLPGVEYPFVLTKEN